MKICRGVFDRCSSARMTWVIFMSKSSTTLARLYRHRAVGPLDHVVLLGGPLDGHLAADVVVELARALARHLQPHDALAALGLEPLRSAAVSAIQRRL